MGLEGEQVSTLNLLLSFISKETFLKSKSSLLNVRLGSSKWIGMVTGGMFSFAKHFYFTIAIYIKYCVETFF